MDQKRKLYPKLESVADLDEEVIKALEKNMKGEKKKSIRGDEWIEEQGLILFRGKSMLPKDEELRKEITCLHHNTSISGHPGPLEDAGARNEKLLVARRYQNMC